MISCPVIVATTVASNELSWDLYCHWLITKSLSTRKPLNKLSWYDYLPGLSCAIAACPIHASTCHTVLNISHNLYRLWRIKTIKTVHTHTHTHTHMQMHIAIFTWPDFTNLLKLETQIHNAFRPYQVNFLFLGFSGSIFGRFQKKIKKF